MKTPFLSRLSTLTAAHSICRLMAKIGEIWKLLEEGVRCIPLLDASHRVTDYSTRDRVRQFMVLEPDIGEHEVSNVLECVTTGWISSQGRFISRF